MHTGTQVCVTLGVHAFCMHACVGARLPVTSTVVAITSNTNAVHDVMCCAVRAVLQSLPRSGGGSTEGVRRALQAPRIQRAALVLLPMRRLRAPLWRQGGKTGMRLCRCCGG